MTKRRHSCFPIGFKVTGARAQLSRRRTLWLRPIDLTHPCKPRCEASQSRSFAEDHHHPFKWRPGGLRAGCLPDNITVYTRCYFGSRWFRRDKK